MPTDLIPVPFAVIKFVPDPIRDEPVNVGVVGITEDRLEYRFIDSLTRFKALLDSDDMKAASIAIRFLRSSLDRSPRRSLEELHDLLYGQVRLSELMGGVSEDPQAFLDDQFEIYVSTPASLVRSRAGEDRTKIKDRIRKAISGVGKPSEFFALSRQPVKGALGRFQFDFGFLNGTATLMHAISFQTREDYALSEAKVLTWAALDTKKVHRGLNIAAVISPPLEETRAYAEARRVLWRGNGLSIVAGELELRRNGVVQFQGRD